MPSQERTDLEPRADWLERLVGELGKANGSVGSLRWLGSNVCQSLPSRKVVFGIVDKLQAILFPGYFGSSDVTHENLPYRLGSLLDDVRRELEEQIRRGLCFLRTEATSATDIGDCARHSTTTFLTRLPQVRARLITDIQAAFEGDPAASSPEETVFCYPGIVALVSHRLAHELYQLEVPLLPRMITEHAHSLTGIDIHPGAEIGDAFFIDHGTGVVIGETSVIGNRVRIYQGVTLGARSFPLDEQGNPIKGVPRHPIVEDEVVIYSGATILGRIKIGRGSTIGGNVWLTHSVEPGTKVSQADIREVHFTQGAGI